MFPARFNGPPGSANGGYACGVVAQQVPANGVEVTLRSPPPLDTALGVERAAERYEVRSDGDELIAVAEPIDEPITADPPVFEIPPDAPPALPADRHPFRTCFTCGPDRAPGDGLRIFAKRLPGQSILADWWTPDASLPIDAHSALYTSDGELLAAARAVWIDVTPGVSPRFA
jgi:hypothetical protein